LDNKTVFKLDIENRHKGEKIIVDNFFTPIVNNVR